MQANPLRNMSWSINVLFISVCFVRKCKLRFLSRVWSTGSSRWGCGTKGFKTRHSENEPRSVLHVLALLRFISDKVGVPLPSSAPTNVFACGGTTRRHWIDPAHFLPNVRGLSPERRREITFPVSSSEYKSSECPDADGDDAGINTNTE